MESDPQGPAVQLNPELIQPSAACGLLFLPPGLYMLEYKANLGFSQPGY